MDPDLVLMQNLDHPLELFLVMKHRPAELILLQNLNLLWWQIWP